MSIQLSTQVSTQVFSHLFAQRSAQAHEHAASDGLTLRSEERQSLWARVKGRFGRRVSVR